MKDGRLLSHFVLFPSCPRLLDHRAHWALAKWCRCCCSRTRVPLADLCLASWVLLALVAGLSRCGTCLVWPGVVREPLWWLEVFTAAVVARVYIAPEGSSSIGTETKKLIFSSFSCILGQNWQLDHHNVSSNSKLCNYWPIAPLR